MVEEQSASTATRTKRVTLKVVTLPPSITVGNLAYRINVDSVPIIKQLMRTGVFANVTQVIDFDTAAAVVRSFGFFAKQAQETTSGSAALMTEEDPAKLEGRSPVVTILGHVDHGKTTLLDAIRKTNVAAKEIGGITQHIGAYQVEFQGRPITFLDTPGHHAFTAMRARGAQVTDIAVLVVAADDGVMPQTVEAIDHIKAAGVPILVAINKVDLPDADPDRVKRELSEHELVVEEWGGDVLSVEVSAKQGAGIEELLESILVIAEVGEFKANPDRTAVGVVIEARRDRSRGPVATILVQTGTLKVSDYAVVGATRGRVKALTSDAGRRIRSAGPSTPVEVLGLGDLPAAGDRLAVVPDERTAREMVTEHQRSVQAKSHGMSLQEFRSRAVTGVAKEMNLVLKTDVQGSIDAVRTALEQLSTAKTRVHIIHAAAGAITEGDVMLAVASEAVLVGFNAPPDSPARRLAEQEGVEVRNYPIIYRLTEDIESALAGMQEPVYEDVVEGRMEVRALFALRKPRFSAGCFVLEGQVSRNSSVRVLRDGKQLFSGSIISLRRFKENVRQVATGYECGLVLDGFDDYKIGDTIEAYNQQRVPQSA